MTEGKIMISNRLLIVLLVLCALFACSEKKPSFNSGKNVVKFDATTSIGGAKGEVPAFVDTSICNIALDVSIEKEYGDIMGDSINKKYGYETFYFSNADTSEYLKLEFHPGGTKNVFGRFVITNFDPRPPGRKLYFSNCSTFATESDVKLGISPDELLKKKGTSYKKIIDKDIVIYSYFFSVDVRSLFYQRYRYPVYSAIYKFKYNRLIEFEFGFEYP